MAESGARLPNFLFLGPDKSGSTWLHAALSRHPNVYLTDAKDLFFFERYFDRGLDWYAAQFRKAGPQHEVVGEICPRYLYARRAPERIHRSLPDVRLMICAREPTRRAYSSYLYLRRQGKRLGSFSQALDSTPALVKRARYATLLRPYLERFGAERIYVGVFDDLQQDPQRFLDGITTWLGLAPVRLPSELLEPKLPARRARSRRLARTASRGAKRARARGLTITVAKVKNSAAAQRLFYRPLADERPRITAADAARIRAALDPEIRELERTFGLELRRRWGWAT
ncbi:MAG: sulfotransferase family protein [Streptosporangiaceae bacterium]